MITFQDSKCQECPAFELRTPEQVKKIQSWHNMFLTEVGLVKPIKLILLGESFPANRYFYDVDSNYEHSGLMYNLKQEFGIKSNSRMIEKLRELGVIVYDCAYCPLCNIGERTATGFFHRNNKLIRQAATYCLNQYKKEFLLNHDCPIITFFPVNGGFLLRQFPEIRDMIDVKFSFNKLHGIKVTIYNLTNQATTS